MEESNSQNTTDTGKKIHLNFPADDSSNQTGRKSQMEEVPFTPYLGGNQPEDKNFLKMHSPEKSNFTDLAKKQWKLIGTTYANSNRKLTSTFSFCEP